MFFELAISPVVYRYMKAVYGSDLRVDESIPLRAAFIYWGIHADIDLPPVETSYSQITVKLELGEDIQLRRRATAYKNLPNKRHNFLVIEFWNALHNWVQGQAKLRSEIGFSSNVWGAIRSFLDAHDISPDLYSVETAYRQYHRYLEYLNRGRQEPEGANNVA